MNYFTPELLAQYRSSDDAIADEAADRWETAIAAYSAHLDKIRPLLPPGARRLLRLTSLHDAQLLTITSTEKGGCKYLFLTFRLAGNPGQPAGGVELCYTLTGGSVLPPPGGGELSAAPSALHVLYDEFDLERKGKKQVFTHALLLSSGLELHLRFTHLSLQRFDRVLLANGKAADIEKVWADELLTTS